MVGSAATETDLLVNSEVSTATDCVLGKGRGALRAARAAERPAGTRVWLCLLSQECQMAKAGCKGFGSGNGPGMCSPSGLRS